MHTPNGEEMKTIDGGKCKQARDVTKHNPGEAAVTAGLRRWRIQFSLRWETTAYHSWQGKGYCCWGRGRNTAGSLIPMEVDERTVVEGTAAAGAYYVLPAKGGNGVSPEQVAAME